MANAKGDAGDKDPMAQAMGVLGWLACQSGKHRWMFVEDDSKLDRACMHCERTEYAVPLRREWNRYPPEEAAPLREQILENGDYFDEHSWDDYFWDDSEWDEYWDRLLWNEYGSEAGWTDGL